MSSVRLTAELATLGFGSRDLARLVRQQSLVHVRRGAYAEPLPPEATAEQVHTQLVAATAPQLHPDAVISHQSAAVLHGLPVWPDALDRVHVTRSRSSGARRRPLVAVHSASLEVADVVPLGGLQVTSLSRTVVDLARTLPLAQAVAAGDRSLNRTTPAALEAGFARMARWPGARAARRTLDLLDARSESAGESASRVQIHLDGLPAPEPQYRVRDDHGSVVARCDFGGEELRTIGEFDGQIKYARLLKPGQTVADVV
ncbi:MAG: hypothetical protein ACLGIF_08755, partial [Actinomycetes bacterium]